MLLKQGDRSNQVREWQEFLNARGERLQADGNFGPMTKAATQRFQTAHGLTADGIVGQNTYLAAAKLGFVGGGFSQPRCQLCGEPMPKGEEMFNYHGYSGPCPVPPVPIGPKVCISAGHSTVPPRDPGASGNGFTESYLALELRDLVADRVRSLRPALNVIEDGADGVSEPLAKAIELAKGAKVAVEFHWNAGPPRATGIEVFSSPEKKQQAQVVAEAIHRATGLVLRGERGWKHERESQHKRLGFVRAGGMIVEVCFISSKDDMDAYKRSKETVADNIATAIVNIADKP